MSFPIIAITGPTASGKSALADAVACSLNTCVLSCDAMQVYRGMDIGTAKTPIADRVVPLKLIDLVDPIEPYSAALYQRDARLEIERMLAARKPIVMCGGTGLYLRAALDEMSFPSGEIDDARRARYNRLAEKLGPRGIHAELAHRDPESAQVIHPNNVKRVVRALEMLDEGISYAQQAKYFSKPRMRYDYMLFALTMNRERLYKRIEDRVDAMVKRGLVDEVRGLVERGAADALTSRQAIGYKEIIEALEGSLSLESAIELIKQRSRRYAKRQLSWCRGDQRTIWIDMDSLSLDEARAYVLSQMEAHSN